MTNIQTNSNRKRTKEPEGQGSTGLSVGECNFLNAGIKEYLDKLLQKALTMIPSCETTAAAPAFRSSKA